MQQQALLQHHHMYHHPALVASAMSQMEPILGGNLPPAFDPSSSCRRVYVGNIHVNVTDKLLAEVFATAGPLAGCKLIRKDKSSYGFVDYHDQSSAALAIMTLHGRQLYGQALKVNWAYGNSQREDTSGHFHVFVGDLSPEITDANLFACFSVFPSCSNARVMWDHKTGRSKGYGFVSFRNQQEAQSAINDLTGKWLGNRQIRCNWATKGVESNEDKQNSDNQNAVVLTNGSSAEGGQESTNEEAPENNPAYTTVYVGNLSHEVTQAELHRHFHALGAGVIEDVRVQRDKGFGFVRYNTHEEAASAIQTGNGKIVCGKPVKCSWGSKSTPPGTASNPLPPPPPAQPYQIAPSTGINQGYSAADLLAYQRQLALSQAAAQHSIDHGDPNVWAHSFEQQHGANGWASEFVEEKLISAADQMGGANISNLPTMEQTRMLAHTLAQNNDPKFQNSKFLQFVSKMSRGELIIDDNQVKPAALSSPGDWATEYQQQYSGGHWADEYARDQLSHGPDQWVNEFAAEREQSGPVDDKRVNEFSKLHVDDWADEFGRQVGEGAFGESSTDNWADTYDEYLNEQVVAKQKPDASRGVYVFTDMNPYVGHPNPLKEGQELFRKGLLSEAVLALEAEVLKNPDNTEGWRLLGIAHAENDDDQQAIAAMMRAHEADPTNLEVLLALGVSHTNEFEQAAALKYLYGWLQHHQKYRTLATPELSDSLYYANVARLFNEAAQIAPEDADVHIVLGVLYNLSREYDKAIAFFQTALKLKPQDYSLWNKLGATQANSVQSADAILAYQQALDLKPNYVRAWANMGISYANQGMYEDSIRYYVRALAMNPKADNAWQYLRISLSCASRKDMLEACDSRNLDALQKEFPL